MEFIDPNSIDPHPPRKSDVGSHSKSSMASQHAKKLEVNEDLFHRTDMIFLEDQIYLVFMVSGMHYRREICLRNLCLSHHQKNVLYQDASNSETGISISSKGKMPNMVSLTLEPFESRTGELFFLNTRLNV